MTDTTRAAPVAARVVGTRGGCPAKTQPALQPDTKDEGTTVSLTREGRIGIARRTLD